MNPALSFALAAVFFSVGTLFIARELTKKFEETTAGTPAELRTHYATHSLKGEFVVILLPAET